MAIYKTRWFDRWARNQNLSTRALCEAVREMAAGLYEADLGGGLLKKRITRPGQGKRGGFRTLVATNKGNRWFFVFGFPKKRAQQHRQGRGRYLEETCRAFIVADAAGVSQGTGCR